VWGGGGGGGGGGVRAGGKGDCARYDMRGVRAWVSVRDTGRPRRGGVSWLQVGMAFACARSDWLVRFDCRLF